MILLILLIANPLTLLEVADLTADYPDVDLGVGVGYPVFMFQNVGYVRAGVHLTADINSNLSRPDWISTGVFLSREIQVNITIGALVGYRLGAPDGWQFGFFLGFDLFPWEWR